MKLKIGDRVLVRTTAESPCQVREGRITGKNKLFFEGWMVFVKEWNTEGKFKEDAMVPIPETASPAQLQAMKVLFR